MPERTGVPVDPGADVTALALALGFTIPGAWRDMRTGRLSDAWALGGLACALAWHGAIGGVSALGVACFGAFVAALVPLLLHALGAIGGGDVKVTLVLGALLGARLALLVELTAFAAVALTGLGLAVRTGSARAWVESWRVMRERRRRARGEAVAEAPPSAELPLAAFLAGAVALLLAWRALG